MGRIRIIGGHWRGRTLPVPAAAGLRPTPERLRETLFNWLAADIAGARCLDLFAGTGILGLEALSRGAREVTLIEKNPRLYARLRSHQAESQYPGLYLVRADACRWLQAPGARRRSPRPLDLPFDLPFDIVFIDPPFHQDLVARCLTLLQTQGWLSEEAWVYVESEPGLAAPPHWQLCKQARAGRVWCRLLRPV